MDEARGPGSHLGRLRVFREICGPDLGVSGQDSSEG